MIINTKPYLYTSPMFRFTSQIETEEPENQPESEEEAEDGGVTDVV